MHASTRWTRESLAVAVVLSAALMLVGCAAGPPTGSVSETEAKQAALKWVANQESLPAWREVASDPETPVSVTFQQRDPGLGGEETPPLWRVEITPPNAPGDLQSPPSSLTVFVSMNGTVESFFGATSP